LVVCLRARVKNVASRSPEHGGALCPFSIAQWRASRTRRCRRTRDPARAPALAPCKRRDDRRSDSLSSSVGISDAAGASKTRRGIKFVVVGDVGCGKTSLIRRYVDGSFSEGYQATIGVDFAHKLVDVSEDLCIDLQLWDVSGEERFAAATTFYYAEAVGALIVFDAARTQTLETAATWKKDVDAMARTAGAVPLPCVLVGNKIDVAAADADAFAVEHGFTAFFGTSAKEGIGVREAIEVLMRQVLDSGVRPAPAGERIDFSRPARPRRCCK